MRINYKKIVLFLLLIKKSETAYLFIGASASLSTILLYITRSFDDNKKTLEKYPFWKNLLLEKLKEIDDRFQRIVELFNQNEFLKNKMNLDELVAELSNECWKVLVPAGKSAQEMEMFQNICTAIKSFTSDFVMLGSTGVDIHKIKGHALLDTKLKGLRTREFLAFSWHMQIYVLKKYYQVKEIQEVPSLKGLEILILHMEAVYYELFVDVKIDINYKDYKTEKRSLLNHEYIDPPNRFNSEFKKKALVKKVEGTVPLIVNDNRNDNDPNQTIIYYPNAGTEPNRHGSITVFAAIGFVVIMIFSWLLYLIGY